MDTHSLTNSQKKHYLNFIGYSNKVWKFIEPLSMLGFNMFTHIIINNNKTFLVFSNQLPVLKYFSTHNKYLDNTLNEIFIRTKKDKLYITLLSDENDDNFTKHFHDYDFWNTLCFSGRLGEKIEIFLFSIPKEKSNIKSQYIELCKPLKQYIAYFRVERDKILHSLQRKARKPWPILQQLPECFPSLEEENIMLTNGLVLDSQLIQTKFGNVGLTAREIDYVKLHCKMHSMPEIGEMLNVSPRTVESMLENVRNKTGYITRNEFIEQIESQLI